MFKVIPMLLYREFKGSLDCLRPRLTTKLILLIGGQSFLFLLVPMARSALEKRMR